MNYIKEINSFYDKLETNPLSGNAINLWHALMAIANKAGWINKFAVAISILEAKTSLNKKAIERARNELSQKGYIVWKKRNGNQSAEYVINSLCDNNNIDFVPQTVPQTVPQFVPQTVPQTVPINKLNETKEGELLARKDDFYNSLIPFVETYSAEMIRSFFDYWSEMDKSKTKMRFELGQTWEIESRLSAWAKKELSFNKNKSNENKEPKVHIVK